MGWMVHHVQIPPCSALCLGDTAISVLPRRPARRCAQGPGHRRLQQPVELLVVPAVLLQLRRPQPQPLLRGELLQGVRVDRPRGRDAVVRDGLRQGHRPMGSGATAAVT